MRYAFGGVRKDVAVAILSFLSPWGLMPRYACPLLADRPRAFRADARTGPPRRHGPRPVRGWHDDHQTRTSSTTGQPRPLATVIWYPAKPGTGTAVGGEFRDAAVLRRRWPIVLFSHGSCGIPEQSLFLTVTLASRGFVVVAPPHPGNEFTDFPACMDPAELVDSYLNRLDDMRFVLDQILVEDDRVGSPFRRKLDRRRIGMSGHSFGGLDTLRVAALDPRVRAALALAPARPDLTGGRIKIPTMLEGAELDTLAPFQTDTLAAYALLDGPRFLVEILNAGHFAFS